MIPVKCSDVSKIQDRLWLVERHPVMFDYRHILFCLVLFLKSVLGFGNCVVFSERECVRVYLVKFIQLRACYKMFGFR